MRLFETTSTWDLNKTDLGNTNIIGGERRASNTRNETGHNEVKRKSENWVTDVKLR